MLIVPLTWMRVEDEDLAGALIVIGIDRGVRIVTIEREELKEEFQ